MPAFHLSHACVVRDLTTSIAKHSVRRPIVTIDRLVRLSLSKWRGHEVSFCSWLMGKLGFKNQLRLKAVLTPPLLGRWDDHVNCKNASGFCSAIRNKAMAGPLGLRLPCSQS